MREIKFRAWDKEFKCFSKNALAYPIEDIGYYTDYEWLQYTGLKDKNGKEIYEGDILKYRWDGKDNIDYIEFRGGSFTYSKCMRWNLCYDEVIGNIYENPSLLRKG